MKIAGIKLDKKRNVYLPSSGKQSIFAKALKIAAKIRGRYDLEVRINRSDHSEATYLVCFYEKKVVCILSLRTHAVKEKKYKIEYFHLTEYRRWMDVSNAVMSYLGENFSQYRKKEIPDEIPGAEGNPADDIGNDTEEIEIPDRTVMARFWVVEGKKENPVLTVSSIREGTVPVNLRSAEESMINVKSRFGFDTFMAKKFTEYKGTCGLNATEECVSKDKKIRRGGKYAHYEINEKGIDLFIDPRPQHCYNIIKNISPENQAFVIDDEIVELPSGEVIFIDSLIEKEVQKL